MYAGAGGGLFDWANDWDVGAAGNYGGGLKYSVNKYVAIRGDVRNLITSHPYTNNLVGTVGFSFRIPHAKEKVEPIPEPPPPPPPPPPEPPVADEVGEVTYHDILFAFDKSDIHPSSYPELNEIAEFLKTKPNLVLEISGYTDSIGTAEYNMGLSQRRAESVEKYIEDKGVPADQLIAKGFGETNPIASNATKEGRRQNRRRPRRPQRGTRLGVTAPRPPCGRR